MTPVNHLRYTDIQQIHVKVVKYITWIYMVLYIDWRVISRYVLHGDGAARTVAVFTMVALLLNLRNVITVFFKKKNHACLLWFLLIIYSFLNSLCHGAPSGEEVILFYRNHIFEPLIFLMITTATIYRHRTITLKIILYALFVFVAFAFFFSGSAANGSGRFYNDAIGNTNSYNAFCLAFVALLLYSEKEINWVISIVAVACASMVIAMAATRSAFLALVIIFVGFLFTIRIKHKFLLLIVALLAFVSLFFGLQFVMENTLIGQRVVNITKVNEPYQVFDTPWLNSLFNNITGDRAFFYYRGMQIFADYPVFGIGLYKFKDVSGYYLPIHPEYMIHLCENGLVGFALLLLFYVAIGFGLLKINIRRPSYLIVIASFGAILFINLVSWTYCTLYYMVIYAIIFNTIYPPDNCGVVIECTEDEADDISAIS